MSHAGVAPANHTGKWLLNQLNPEWMACCGGRKPELSPQSSDYLGIMGLFPSAFCFPRNFHVPDNRTDRRRNIPLLSVALFLFGSSCMIRQAETLTQVFDTTRGLVAFARDLPNNCCPYRHLLRISSAPFSATAYTVVRMFPRGIIGKMLASQTLKFSTPLTKSSPSSTPSRSALAIAHVPHG